MSRDLYDIAKPVRDAALAEIMRCFEADTQAGEAPIDPALVDGHKLGAHLQAMCIAYCGERYKGFATGFVTGDRLIDIYVVALAQIAAHMAATARPTAGGRPLTPTQSGQVFLQRVADLFFRQLAHMEHGLVDYNIPFQRKEDGSIEVETFDFDAMLNKGRGS